MRLAELLIENYKGIGDEVRIKIDDIVVLIGNNNVGKTTILSAYEAFAKVKHILGLTDFHQEDVTRKPTITGIFEDVRDGEMTEKWIHKDENLGYDNCIKVKYVWNGPGKEKEKYSYNPEDKEFIKGGTEGIDTILLSKIPTPIKISPLDQPKDLELQVLAILTEAIKENIKKDANSLSNLIGQIENLAEKVKDEIKDEIDLSTEQVASELTKVFPELDHIEIDIKSGKIEPEKFINAGSFIRIGNKLGENGVLHRAPLQSHGTGLQRTFLWSSLKMLADTGRHKIGRSKLDQDKTKILLIEEPEAFLHPSAIKEARESLYGIAELANWQVMTTSHSPVFIDLTKNHTTIIRLEKNKTTAHSVKTFSTDEAGFDANDKTNLQMLNFCNPYINEFFFANEILLVEGETEYATIKHFINEKAIPQSFKIINCIGKANIVTVAKILNHFKINYSVLHDADNPTILRNNRKIRNSAWTNNHKIVDEVRKGIELGLTINKFVSIPNFEGHYLGGKSGQSKPYEAITFFQDLINNESAEHFLDLIKYVAGMNETTPGQLYSDIDTIISRTKLYIDQEGLEEDQKWDVEYYYSDKEKVR